MLRKGHRGHNHRERAGRDRQEGDGLREEEAANDSCYDESRSSHGEVANDDGSHPDEGCSHEEAVVHAHSIHQMVDSRLDGMVGENEIDSDHCVGPRPESIDDE